MSGQRFYSEEEAQEVLKRAMRQPIGGMSRDELVRSAIEMGISPDAIEQAEAEIEHERLGKLEQEKNLALRREFEIHNRNRLLSGIGESLSPFLICSVIWFMTGQGYFWPMWVAFPLALHLISVLNCTFFNRAQKERRFEKWLARKRGEETEKKTVELHPGGLNIRIDS